MIKNTVKRSSEEIKVRTDVFGRMSKHKLGIKIILFLIFLAMSSGITMLFWNYILVSFFPITEINYLLSVVITQFLNRNTQYSEISEKIDTVLADKEFVNNLINNK